MESFAPDFTVALIERQGWVDVASLEAWAKTSGCVEFWYKSGFATGRKG